MQESSMFNPPRMEIPNEWIWVPVPLATLLGHVKCFGSTSEAIGSGVSFQELNEDNVQVGCEDYGEGNREEEAKAPVFETSLKTESMKKRKYWNLPDTKEKSEKMSERRSKVVSNPRVGRQGYAVKAVKLKEERETTPTLTDRAEGLKTSEDNPSSNVMEKKN